MKQKVDQDLERIIKLFDNEVERNEEAHKNLERVRAELSDNSDNFLKYLRNSVEQDARLHYSVKFWWLNKDGKNWFPPKQFSLHLKNHVLKMQRTSGYYSIAIILSGLLITVGATDIKENWPVFSIGLLASFLIGWFKFNVDTESSKYSVLANHLDSLE